MTKITDLIGASSSGGAFEIVDRQIFTASGTWTKPATARDTDWLLVDIWSAGGSGGISASYVSGGAGGGFHRLIIPAFAVPDSVLVVVGSGGAAVANTGASSAGRVGGSSSFGDLAEVLGGEGGVVGSHYNYANRGGGVVRSAVDVGPLVYEGCTVPDMTDQGACSAVYKPGGDSLRGGGAGGGCRGDTGSSFAGGVSGLAGAGGRGSRLTAPGAGQYPAGGGGAAGASGGYSSGAGANGLIKSYILRGSIPSAEMTIEPTGDL